ncbi:hypothetical protein QEH59_02570 [Coraliomargarita sp. SDUM461004]|uniref:Class I SAM-dependent methyltransferase n=1 Tax=Thalassobacterium sedimentorum TaxID=3041258 RepID=A0ABU1AER9_9BACT|nr:hypothetical protein [Coraliomargarita sp. SDUM461004]MDQ8193292.1 hypothetical protein [Coraliomargarita sp. SDUM461004]
MTLKATFLKVIRKSKDCFVKKYVPGKHRDDYLGWIINEEFLTRQTRQIQQMLQALANGVTLDEVLQGFDGRRCGERIVEYPYFIDWYERSGACETILDIGCVLNNPAVSLYLNTHVESLWFCNPAVESLVLDRPTYYHISKLIDAFPAGERFKLITCLSTIEHIGYDNSQYGSKEAALYDVPSDEPLLTSIEKISELLLPEGKSLISVPFGLRAVNLHRVTKLPAFQSFDWASAQAVKSHARSLGLDCHCVVYAGDENGWKKIIDPANFQEPYGHGFPGAPAVLMIELTKPS